MKNHDEKLIALVDENDRIIGYDDKIKVHEEGKLHRAFSILIFNNAGELLIHERAHHKYHSPSLWTNTCCSHLYENASMDECVHERLQFEMGFDANVDYKFKFTYKETFGNGLIEHETDHVYMGIWEGIPNPNTQEVAAYKWITWEALKIDMNKHPNNYTYWFKYLMKHFEAQFN
ncbi:MAG: isopentenyl-diphosphate Delta-isomerase [Salinivirgaceae bacterium]|nr:isopentenyl-diphosphate Delta-isomerase [Salinivirgaceae bacterium]